MPYDQQPNYQNNPYYIWGSYSATNPGLFDEIMNMEYGCVTSDEFELVECISDKYDEFIDEYDLEISESEGSAIKKAIKHGGECGDGFEEKVYDILADQYVDTALDNLSDGHRIRLLDCSSFQWNLIGNGWVSCLSPTNMEVEIGNTGIDFYIDLGCLSYTIPNTRINGEGM
ncbi:MAG: hypothetical protein AAGA77_01855 [Bacteroidota bacterium]